MRSKFPGYVIALTVTLAVPSLASAQPRNRNGKGASAGSSDSAGDKTIEKQMEWEKKVMGDDNGKAAEMRKIAAAQKLADEAAKHPQPIQAPKVRDPNKEGVRAKQEAAIGLPIASDQETRTTKKSTNTKKADAPSSPGNDELGAMVASSLAAEKSAEINSSRQSRSDRGGRGKGGKNRGKGPAAAPTTLDQMFATSK